jgi:micrococcal nuclease
MGMLRILLRFLRRDGGRERRHPAPPPTHAVRPALTPEIVVIRQTVTVARRQTVSGRAYVIDGDTIDLAGVRIRLFGIDAPELDHPFGNNAKWALVRFCKGQTIRAEIDGEPSYDRSVARCYLPDGRDLSAEMVKAGMAVDWPKFSGGQYARMEPSGIRKKLWRCDARQKGRMPPRLPD